jgi:hypothetical protein
VRAHRVLFLVPAQLPQQAGARAFGSAAANQDFGGEKRCARIERVRALGEQRVRGGQVAASVEVARAFQDRRGGGHAMGENMRPRRPNLPFARCEAERAGLSPREFGDAGPR